MAGEEFSRSSRRPLYPVLGDLLRKARVRIKDKYFVHWCTLSLLLSSRCSLMSVVSARPRLASFCPLSEFASREAKKKSSRIREAVPDGLAQATG